MGQGNRGLGKRGFGSMDPAKQREIAQRGGKAAHASGKAHEFTREEAQRAGAKGGQTVSSRPGHMAAIGRKGGTTVSSEPGHMAEIGRKGGYAASRDTAHMSEIGRKGGASVAAKPGHMSEIGIKGGAAKAAATR